MSNFLISTILSDATGKAKQVVSFLQYTAECTTSVMCKSLKSSMISMTEGGGILVFQPISVPIRTFKYWSSCEGQW